MFITRKMRKPDPPVGAEPMRKKRSSAAAVMSGTSNKPPSSSSNDMDPGVEGDGDTEDRSSLEANPGPHAVPNPPSTSTLPLRGMSGNYINPEYFPLPVSRPGSAAAMYSPGPPTRTTGSTTSSMSTATNGTSTSSSTSATTTVKRKKSRPQLPLSDEESDGAQADEEYVVKGSMGGGSAAWMHVNVDTGRRKGLPKRSAATAAVAALEDIRRHSMAI